MESISTSETVLAAWSLWQIGLAIVGMAVGIYAVSVITSHLSGTGIEIIKFGFILVTLLMVLAIPFYTYDVIPEDILSAKGKEIYLFAMFIMCIITAGLIRKD